MATQHLGGRGGAGNVQQSKQPQEPVSADDLKTPTIKQSTYTTGRGGAGNMASNESAESARRAQDVDAPEVHQKEMKGTYHWGRGGEGNMTTVGEDSKEKEKSKSPLGRGAGGERRRSSMKEMKDKGKDFLGLKGADKEKKMSESAVAVEDD